MSLFRRLHLLVGALVHRPFLPKAEKVDLDEVQVSGPQESGQASSSLEAGAADLPDRERVADLIARQQRDAS